MFSNYAAPVQWWATPLMMGFSSFRLLQNKSKRPQNVIRICKKSRILYLSVCWLPSYQLTHPLPGCLFHPTLPSHPVSPASAAAPTPPSPSNTGLTGFGAKQGGLGTSFDSLQLLGTSWVIKIWVTVYVGHRFTANKLLGTRLIC